MHDREKVIKGLYLCKWTSAGRYDGYEPDYESCCKCPYRRYDFVPDVCCAELMKDALELLKGHEPVQFKVTRQDKSYPFWDAVCTGCGYKTSTVKDYWNYCPVCGRKVKWDE